MNPLLVFSTRHEIRGLELPGLGVRTLISSLKNTIALDWYRDPTNGTVSLYWTDVVDDTIYRGVVLGNGERLHFLYSLLSAPSRFIHYYNCVSFYSAN